MGYEWLDEALLQKPGAIKDYKVEWTWFRYMVGGKLFAALMTDRAGHPVVSLKLEPLEGEFLRGQYLDITPGYYMNKQHWNTIRLDGAVPESLILELAEKSYRLVLKGLKRADREALGI